MLQGNFRCRVYKSGQDLEKKSRNIETNQAGVHERLEHTVRKHLLHPFQRPIADHTQTAFSDVQVKLATHVRPLILDSCCGTADSSRVLATDNPDHWVVGIDKSEHRLHKEHTEKPPENLILLRADLNDFYRLAVIAGWQPVRHYLLYPNPWPKSAHLGRRWHGAPVFPDILKLGGCLELRSNWKIYLDEFQIALSIAGYASEIFAFEPTSYLTAFEKKYHLSSQPLWRLTCNLDRSG